jgi:cytochrome c-type biogenesis protein CcmH
MLFWVAATVLTLCAVLVVVLPVVWTRDSAPEGVSYDLEVYRDQLSELERDCERGLIDTGQAEEARAEIGRRIIALGGELETAPGGSGGRQMASLWVALAGVLVIPLAGWGLYGMLGSPQSPDQPLRQRIAGNPDAAGNLANTSVSELVAKAEQQLSLNSEDGRGWAVLAPIYLRVGRFDDAVVAFRNAIRLIGSKVAFEAGLGEAYVGRSGGVVTSDAQAAFERALAIDPKDVRSRYYMATAHTQDGRLESAAVAWQELLRDTEGTAAWRQSAQSALAETRRRLAMRSGSVPEVGPDRETVDAAAEMSEEDRNEMILAMVARLDERLRNDANDLQGWKQLVRSYLVLGRPEQARDALARGASALGANESDELASFGQSLGLKSVE